MHKHIDKLEQIRLEALINHKDMVIRDYDRTNQKLIKEKKELEKQIRIQNGLLTYIR